ncbi:Na+/H+ antiporter NhaA [Pasteurella multocida]|uniref:Na+/H+ antiporter NhaA n=1 Tax=Pasteurella multocida TaxID=747 RepID=UPI002A587C03|nr:Na+/H+ antiporter NhaA [Pasteurella multocida]MDY0595176.1 Na+/H+ antiporter NhaA [Pasteurella multocida]MDY0664577.1 Na+/H+ antiporter NhaA [Pasteurella multocida]MDY0666610.1 Na+/H+ antiporter NhaA [Pasteurella multocida]
MLTPIQNFLKQEAAGGILLFIFATLAIILANTPLSYLYFDFLQTPVSIQIGAFIINKPLLMWVNDGLMAVFFMLVGMEVKRELLEGSLSSYQRAVFPAIAATGGMVVPAIVFLVFNATHPEFQEGWAIPMATDIAFALGVIALLGKRVPLALKIFLLALAIIDDLGAIVVIALFFSHDLSPQAFIFAGVTVAILITMNRLKITALSAYGIVGIILWASVLKSGVHATLAGVIIGFCIPLNGKKGERPLDDFEHTLSPWSAFAILPLFAFCNAGVSLIGMGMDNLTSTLPMGIALGLLLGKPLGIFSFCFVAVKLGIAKLSEGINFKQIFAVSVLCGIGFTMSMFLAGLAFDGKSDSENVTALARLGILIGSGFSAVLGYLLLKMSTKDPIEAQ